MRKDLGIAFVVISLVAGFAIGVFAGYDLARRQVDATKLTRDLTAINTSATTLEMNDKGARNDIAHLHVVTLLAYAKEAGEKAALFKRSPVRDPRLIQGVARAETWATAHKAMDLAGELGRLRQRLTQIGGQ